MCGIAGRFNFRSGAPVAPDLVRQMCDLLAHRGPDGHGIFVDGSVGLGHRRLAILDLSEAGHQPMATSDRDLWITFNGEIYNFLELRADLSQRGHRFSSGTDTEVILAAYREFGVSCLDRLRGMFAFAIWDRVARSLFIARDRLGKKPLHYWLDDDGIAFASEPKAFLADPGFVPTPHLEAISHYLSYQCVPSPWSAFAHVYKLPPAHYAVVADGHMQTTRYWSLRYGPKRRITEQEASEELVSRLEDAVRLRLISDVPLGAFLSGGVDSSAIVALMARQVSQVKTFSIGFDEQDFNELAYAREIVERYSTDHHEFVVRPNAQEIFSQLVWHYNEPFADPSAIPTYYLAQLTRQHVTVALNGDAGDENFAGYSRYLPPRGMTGMFDRLPSGARQLAHAAARSLGSRAAGWSARAKRWTDRLVLSPAQRYLEGALQFPRSLKADICTTEFLCDGGQDSDSMVLEEFRRSNAAEWLDTMLDVDVNRYLPDALLVKVDIASMAHGLEARSPMLDHSFMEFAATLPTDFKLRGLTTKYILKRAVRPLLPAAVIDRPKKGFSVPLNHWFRHDLKDMAYDTLLSPRANQRGYFRPAVVKRLLDEHIAQTHDWADQLWNLLMLELWHRTFIDSRPRTARLCSEPSDASIVQV